MDEEWGGKRHTYVQVPKDTFFLQSLMEEVVERKRRLSLHAYSLLDCCSCRVHTQDDVLPAKKEQKKVLKKKIDFFFGSWIREARVTLIFFSTKRRRGFSPKKQLFWTALPRLYFTVSNSVSSAKQNRFLRPPFEFLHQSSHLIGVTYVKGYENVSLHHQVYSTYRIIQYPQKECTIYIKIGFGGKKNGKKIRLVTALCPSSVS